MNFLSFISMDLTLWYEETTKTMCLMRKNLIYHFNPFLYFLFRYKKPKFVILFDLQMKYFILDNFRLPCLS